MTFRFFKVGGLRFLRIGRVQFSFCICKAKPAPKPARTLRLAAPARDVGPMGVEYPICRSGPPVLACWNDYA